ncbi:Hypothetical_protein [Hexamita inflata]|uniref:Hypothetical_protein n=1 Tax=Hexamita inflata TaxID=28002 RepID=A0AA86PNQ2_9EUKA|nr:Hypothetical protein HINF_LOCUS31205 [Hexamita inflata]
MLSLVMLKATTTCSTKMTVIMAEMTVNLKDSCPIDMNCLNMPFETYIKDYMPQEYQEGIDEFTQMVSIKNINICNIWPTDGCITPETCIYYKQCSQTCNSKCLYNSGTFTRTIAIQMDGSVPTTKTLNGMLYCDYSTSKLSTGAYVGIGIGIFVAVSIVVSIVVFFFIRKNGKSNKVQQQMKNPYF